MGDNHACPYREALRRLATTHDRAHAERDRHPRNRYDLWQADDDFQRALEEAVRLGQEEDEREREH